MSDAPECCDWEERLQDWIDGDLDPAQSDAVDEHIAGCITCRARVQALQALDEALSGRLLPAAPEDSFDRRVLERIAVAARTDRAAARARAEQEWRNQLAALSHQRRHAWRSAILNAMAVAALLITLMMSLRALPALSQVMDQIEPLTQYVSIRPAVTLPMAAGLTVVALWLVRSLALAGW